MRRKPESRAVSPGRAGRAVDKVAALGSAVRRARVVHPRGEVFRAVVATTGEHRHGAALLDTPGEHAALVRLSKAVSTPAGLPDILGLAIRVHGAGADGGPLDLALATTGTAPGLRHLLVPRRDFCAAYTSLLPYSVGGRRRMLAATPADPARGIPADPAALVTAVTGEPLAFHLLVAGFTGPWLPAATLTLTGPDPHGADPAFDVVRNALDDLRPAGWLNRLRGPAYRGSQRGRGRIDG